MRKKELLRRIECLEELTSIMGDEIKSLRRAVGYPLDLELDHGFKVVPKVWPFADPLGRLASTKILSPAQ